jgi:hypothetical protein
MLLKHCDTATINRGNHHHGDITHHHQGDVNVYHVDNDVGPQNTRSPRCESIMGTLQRIKQSMPSGLPEL